MADPHIAARDMVLETLHPTLGRIRTLGTPLKMSQTPLTPGRAAPLLGEHTDEVLAEIGIRPGVRSGGCGTPAWSSRRRAPPTRLETEAAFVVQSDVESLSLLVWRHPQTDRAIDNLDNDERHASAVDGRGRRSDELDSNLGADSPVEPRATESRGREDAG